MKLQSGTKEVILITVATIYILGTLVNGLLLVVFVRARKRLLQARIEKVGLALTASTFCFGLWRMVNYAFILTYGLPVWYLGAVMTASINVSLCISDFLAIERYLISHNMLEEHTKKFFVWWGLFKLFLAVAGIVSLALEAFNSSGHLRDRVTDLNTIPDFDTVPFTIWATCLAVSAAISVITTIMLYWRSCVAVVEKFQNSSLSHTVDRIILILERNVLKNALIMSSTVIICYFPLALVTLLVILDVEVPIWVGYVVLLLVGMDTLAVPFQIIYFMPNVRAELKHLPRCSGGNRRESVH